MRWPHITWTCLLTLAACQRPEPARTMVPASPDSLLVQLARDTGIIHTPHAFPSDSALGVLLGKLGVPFDTRLANAEPGCELFRAANEFEKRVDCVMRAGTAAIEIEVLFDKASGWVDSLRIFDIPLDSRSSPRQTIVPATEASVPEDEAVLYAEDYDGDGTRELAMLKFEGGTGNQGFFVWRFNPATRMFAADSVLSEMVTGRRLAGRPCIRQSWNWGNMRLDRSDWIECWRDGRWQSMWTNSGHVDEKRNLVFRSVTVWLNGAEHLVRADSIPLASWRATEEGS